jgi:hypothetical protein
MDSKINKYIVPVLLPIIAIIAQFLYFDNHSIYLMRNMPINVIILVTLIYAIITIKSIPKENTERIFWIMIAGYLSLDLLQKIVWYFVMPNLSDNASIMEYIYSWKSIFSNVFSFVVFSLLIFGLYKLIKHLGITSKKREMNILKWTSIVLASIVIGCLAFYMMLFTTNMMLGWVYFGYGLFVSMFIPLVIVLLRNIPQDKLRIPVSLITFSVLSYLLMFAFGALGMLHNFFGYPTPAFLEILRVTSISVATVLGFFVYMFMMMSMASRIEIAKQPDTDTEVFEIE